MALPGEVDNLKFNLTFFGSGCLVHFWLPYGSLCGFKALIGPCLGSLEPQNFVRALPDSHKFFLATALSKGPFPHVFKCLLCFITVQYTACSRLYLFIIIYMQIEPWAHSDNFGEKPLFCQSIEVCYIVFPCNTCTSMFQST